MPASPYLTGTFIANHMNLCTGLSKRTLVHRSFSTMNLQLHKMNVYVHFDEGKNLTFLFGFAVFFSVPTLTKRLGRDHRV